jgi:hypothetical protein
VTPRHRCKDTPSRDDIATGTHTKSPYNPYSHVPGTLRPTSRTGPACLLAGVG